MTEFIDISDELFAALQEADRAVRDAVDRLREVEAAHQRLLDDAAAPIARFKVGEDVIAHRGRYRITRVRGEEFGLTGQRAKVWVRYHGQRIKVDGSLMDHVKVLHDPQPSSDEDQSK